jgi:hypothetical protein
MDLPVPTCGRLRDWLAVQAQLVTLDLVARPSTGPLPKSSPGRRGCRWLGSPPYSAAGLRNALARSTRGGGYADGRDGNCLGQRRTRVLIEKAVPLVDKLARMTRPPVIRGVVADVLDLVRSLRSMASGMQ